MSKMEGFSRHLILVLILFLAIAAIAAFVIGHDPNNDWKDSFRDLASSLTAELIGAAIGVFVINKLLEKHREQSLQIPRRLVQQRVYSLAVETIRAPMSKIAGFGEGDPINTIAWLDLLEMIRNHDYSQATDHLLHVLHPPNLLRRSNDCSKIEKVTTKLLQEWRILWDLFGSYLTPQESTSCMRVITHLESLLSESTRYKLAIGTQTLDDQGKVVDLLLAQSKEVLSLLQNQHWRGE